MKEYKISPNDAGQRLDAFLGKVLNAPKSLIYKAIRKKRVKVNGKKSEISYKLKTQDVLQLYINDEFFNEQKTEFPWMDLKPKIDIIYEDDNILVVNKPSGMLSQAEADENINSLESHVRAYLYNKNEIDIENEHTFLPSLCHRIDRNTSGLVIAAKNAESLRIINQKIRNREIKKYYICEVEGKMPNHSGEISGYISKNERENKMYFSKTAKENSRECSTRYKVLREDVRTSKLEAELITGRTHQIRATFSYLGHPIVGDVKYGARHNGNKSFQHLEAYKLLFDFVSDGGILEYLNGKKISLDLKEN
ncbi:MAG: RluA family pseudouridine synthase [Oscillospiraceae bacterium]